MFVHVHEYRYAFSEVYSLIHVLNLSLYIVSFAVFNKFSLNIFIVENSLKVITGIS